MIPLNDTEANRYSRAPGMTILLIVLNTIVSIAGWIFYQPDFTYLLFGAVPTFTLDRVGGGALTTFSSMFLHGDIFHLFFNMLALWVFGRRVEDACGPWRFLAFYLLCGTTADLLTTLVMFNSPIPGIGASGAIYGLMGAHLILFPGGRIRTLFFISIIPFWPKLRAIWIVLYFVASQILPAYLMAEKGEFTGVGHWAHLGGFFGSIAVLLFLRPEAYLRYHSHESV